MRLAVMTGNSYNDIMSMSNQERTLFYEIAKEKVSAETGKSQQEYL